MKRWKGTLITLSGVVMFWLALVWITGSSVLPYLDNQKIWLTAPLRREGDQLILIGPDLSRRVEKNQVFTYYQTSEWVTLEWEGYNPITFENRWKITPELKAEKPDWEKNTAWSGDFPGTPWLWKIWCAHPGTSAKPAE